MGICWLIPCTCVLQPADGAWHVSTAEARQILRDECQAKMFLTPEVVS